VAVLPVEAVPAIEGLVTSTRISPRVKARSASSLDSSWSDPAHLDRPGDEHRQEVALVVAVAPGDAGLGVRQEFGGPLAALATVRRSSSRSSCSPTAGSSKSVPGRIVRAATTCSRWMSGGRAKPSSG
jgi:hypothetical protein